MAIASLTEAKVHLGIEQTDNTENERLQLHLDAMEDFVSKRFADFGLKIKQETLIEIRDGGLPLQIFHLSPTIRQFRHTFHDPPKDTALDHIFTKFRPIISVTSVHESIAGKDQVFDSTTLISADDYVVKNKQGIIQLINGLHFDRGHSSIRLEYVAGFQPVPRDIKMAVLMGVDQIFGRAGRGALKSERMGEYSYAIKEAQRMDEDLTFFLRNYLKNLQVKGA